MFPSSGEEVGRCILRWVCAKQLISRTRCKGVYLLVQYQLYVLIVKGSDEGMVQLILLGFWILSIFWYCKWTQHLGIWSGDWDHLFLMDRNELVPHHSFTWGEKQKKFPSCFVLFRIRQWTVIRNLISSRMQWNNVNVLLLINMNTGLVKWVPESKFREM